MPAAAPHPDGGSPHARDARHRRADRLPQILDGEILNRTQTTVVIEGVNYSTGQVQVIRQDPGTGIWGVAQLLDETWFPPGQYTTAYDFWNFSASEELLLANGPYNEGPNGETNVGRAFSFLRDPVTGDWVAGEILERAVLPANEFGYLFASSAPGFIPNVGGSSGDLCIAGGPDFGRFSDQVQSSGALGLACTTVPLPLVPTAKGPHVLLPAETWYFQYWYRDGTTSNHTDGVEILFE